MLHISLKKGKERRVRAFHPWVYSDDILSFSRKPVPGEVCTIRDYKGNFIGKGYINPDSYITVRLMTYRKDVDVDRNLLRERIRRAFEYRKSLKISANAFRVVHSEADFLPGLIVDFYDRYAVVQITTLGMELRKEHIVDAILKEMQPDGIYEKSTVQARELEGLPLVEGILYGNMPDRVIIEENGVKFIVKIKRGQKTGMFLDQRENRLLFSREFVKKGGRVLDLFCHTGGFGLYAAMAGASQVYMVDSSEHALSVAKENADINGVGGVINFVKEDAFTVLKEFDNSGEVFDSVVIDPPAFAKSKKHVESARRGYKELFLRGLKILSPGGGIVVCSCSHHVTLDILKETLQEAAYDAKVILRILYTTYQSKDHPFILQIPETQYLKCIFAKKLGAEVW